MPEVLVGTRLLPAAISVTNLADKQFIPFLGRDLDESLGFSARVCSATAPFGLKETSKSATYSRETNRIT